MPFSLKEHFDFCQKIIKASCKAFLGDVEKISCAIVKVVETDDEKIEVSYAGRPSGFSYTEGNHQTVEDFCSDVATDVTLSLLDRQHNIFARIPTDPLSDMPFSVSLTNNIFMGRRILNRFWNADTLTFSFDAFALAAAEISQREQVQQEASQGRSASAARTRGTLLAPLPVASLPQGVFVPAFAAEVQALRGEFALDVAMKGLEIGQENRP